MRFRKKKAIVYFLAAVMLAANISTLAFASAGAGAKTAAENDDTQAAKPAASIKEGTDKDTWSVSLSTSTKDAVIYYTVDGKTPTEKSKKYDSKKPVEIKETTTVKAIAVKKDLKDSEVASFVYKLTKSESGEKKMALVTPTPTKAAANASAAGETKENAETKSEASVTPAPTAAETKTAEPAVTSEPVKANEPAAAAEPTKAAEPTVTDEPAGEPMPIADPEAAASVEYSGTITVGTTELSDLSYDSSVADSPENYTLDSETGKTYKIDKVTWTPKDTAGESIEAGKTYTVEVTLTLTGGAAEGTAPGKVTFLGTDLTKNSDSTVYKREITVPAALDAAITAEPESDSTVKKGDTIKLKLSEGADGAVIQYSTDGGKTFTDYSEDKGIEVPEGAAGTFSVTARVKSGSFVSAEQTFEYTVETTFIKKVTISGLSYRDRGGKPDMDFKVPTTGVTESAIKWTTDKKGSKEVNADKVLSANKKYYVFITLTAEDGYKFDTNAFKNAGKIADVVKGLASSFDAPKVTSVSATSLTIRVTNKTKAPDKMKGKNEVTKNPNKTSYPKGSQVEIKMSAASNTAKEGNKRYIIEKYKLGSNSEVTVNEASRSVKPTFNQSGKYTVRVTFRKQKYHNGKWENTNKTKVITREITITSSSSTSTTTPTPRPTTTSSASTSTRSSGANTEDSTPIGMYVSFLVLAAAVIAGVTVYRRKAR